MKKQQKNGNNGYTVVTGSSSGIGEATALLAAKKKWPLILVARRLEKLKKIQKQCLKLGSPDVLIFKVDVKNKKEILNFVSQLKKNKNIEIKNLVNSAGLAKGIELFQNSNTQDWDDMIETNVSGLLHFTKGLLPFVIQKKGHIVNLGSVAGRLVYEGGAVYCASKFAVRAISDGLRMDLKGTGVRVTNIEPGMVNTEFSLVRLGNQQKADAVYHDMMPLSANDIAETILWCVERPAHVNIQELVIYPTDQASVGQVMRGNKSIKNLME